MPNIGYKFGFNRLNYINKLIFMIKMISYNTITDTVITFYINVITISKFNACFVNLSKFIS